LTGEPAASEVERLLRAVEDPPCISAVNIAETVDVLARIRVTPMDDVQQKLDWLVLASLEVVPVDEHIGRLAGELRARHYDRTVRPLSLADCIAAATAIARAEALATSDPALAATARSEGVRVVSLPDAAGRRP
jgi:predicted nucleic acid-binding protein